MPFEVKYECGDCDHVFYRVTDHDPRKTKGGRPPACPECKKAEAQTKSQMRVRGDVKVQTQEDKNAKMDDIIESKKFPSQGHGAFTKAMDMTAKMVMEDYQMTDLRDNLREGDDMVPKLRPDLERQVSQGFNLNQKNNVAGLAGANLNKALTAGINSKAFAKQGDVVQQAVTAVQRPTVNIIGDYQPERPH